MEAKKKIKFLTGEKWKVLELPRNYSTRKYAISTHGRAISFTEKMEEGTLLSPTPVSDYPAIIIGKKGKKGRTRYMHRMVAEFFCKKPSKAHEYVIHLNHKKDDNYYKNLKWVKEDELIPHARLKPGRKFGHADGFKLNEAKVRVIKKKLADGKTPVKALAKQFKVSEMAIYRIKWGENWSHLK